jgi:hypothetical protein
LKSIVLKYYIIYFNKNVEFSCCVTSSLTRWLNGGGIGIRIGSVGKCDDDANVVSGVLVGHDVPDPVAGKDEELILFVEDGMNEELWLMGDQLLRGALPLRVLAFDVTEGPQHCEGINC